MFDLQTTHERKANSGNRKTQATTAARYLYQQATQRNWLSEIWSILTRSRRRLYDLTVIQEVCTIVDHHFVGIQPVQISQIQGSSNAGRCRDFDADFRPLMPNSQSRWVSVATARQLGKKLPPVALTLIKGAYFVEDGHHRISVARALGEDDIEATVTEWRIAGPLPWSDRPTRPVLPVGKPVTQREG